MVEEKAHCAAPTRPIRLWPNGAVLLVVDPGGQVFGGPGGRVFLSLGLGCIFDLGCRSYQTVLIRLVPQLDVLSARVTAD